MAFSPADFADDTDFERFVLALLGARRIQPETPDTRFDLRGDRPQIVVQVGAAVSGGRSVSELRGSLRPLMFGAAYKTLDLLVEHVLRANGAGSDRLTFRRKERALLANWPSTLPTPFDAHPELWDRLALTYIALQDARHAMTHRRAGITAAGDLDVHNDQRRKTDTVTAEEIAAFAATVHAAASVVVDGSDDERRSQIVAAHLNELQGRHGLPALPAADPDAGVRLLEADLGALDDDRWRLDIRRLRDTVEGQEHSSLWNLELHAGDDRVFVGHWESVPNKGAEHFDFDLSSPPDWLTEQVASS